MSEKDIFLPKKFLGDVIDRLRNNDEDDIADKLQFGEEGKDEFDGHRCRLCHNIAGGDASHRCWDETWMKENMGLYPCPRCGKPYSIFDPKICKECRRYAKIMREDSKILSEESYYAAQELVSETMKIFEAEKIELVRRFGWTDAAEAAKVAAVFKMLKRCLVQRFDPLCYVLALCGREPSFKHVCLKSLTEDYPEITLDIGTRDFLEEE